MAVRASRAPALAANELDLQVGEPLQIQFLDDETRAQHYVKVIGFLPERSVLVTTPEKDGRPLAVRQGRAVLVRAFSGLEARGFTSVVLLERAEPYPYLHLSFPSKIEDVAERRAGRVRSAIAVNVRVAGAATDVPAVIRDVSSTGAQLLASEDVGQAGDRIMIHARLPLAVIGDQAVELPALIRNAQPETAVKGSLWRFRCGVEFDPLDTQSTLALRAYLYERLTRDEP